MYSPNNSLLKRAAILATLAPLALAASESGSCQQYEYTDNFIDGFADNWIQMAGAEHEDSLVQMEGGGIQLVLRQAVAQSTNIMSRLQFTSGKMEFDLKTNGKTGVMYALTLWPSDNVAGQGEIDLELLGADGANTDIIQCPIWAPDHGTPIVYANEPSDWGQSDASGPTVDYGDATATSTAHWVSMPDFDNTQTNRFAIEITGETLSWHVNGSPFASWTKGSDESLWPVSSDKSTVMSFAAWANQSSSNWMGLYEYDETDPPALTISNLQFSGCVTNVDELTVPSASSSSPVSEAISSSSSNNAASSAVPTSGGVSGGDSASSTGIAESASLVENSGSISASGMVKVQTSAKASASTQGTQGTGESTTQANASQVEAASSIALSVTNSQTGASPTKECLITGTPVKAGQPTGSATGYNPAFAQGPTATASGETPPDPIRGSGAAASVSGSGASQVIQASGAGNAGGNSATVDDPRQLSAGVKDAISAATALCTVLAATWTF